MKGWIWDLVQKQRNTRTVLDTSPVSAFLIASAPPTVSESWEDLGVRSYPTLCGIMRREPPPTLNDLITLFKKIDKNGDGLISTTELTKLLTKVSNHMY